MYAKDLGVQKTTAMLPRPSAMRDTDTDPAVAAPIGCPDMIEAQSSPHSNIQRHRLAIFAILGAISVLVAIEQTVIARLNDWWVDELFALWASDRNIGFVELFRTRIAPDSNPPLFFSLLHGTRLLISHDRIAVIALNLTTLVIGAGSILAIAWRSRYRDWVAFSVALFVLGGPLAAYLPEARAYCLAMTASYVAVMLSALAVMDAEHRPGWLPFAIVGVVAGLSHVFAALLCCSLAAAMIGVELVAGTYRPRASALALGVSAIASTFIWMLIWFWLGPGTFAQVNWIPFTAAFVWESGVGALGLTYGAGWLAVTFGFVVGVALIDRRSRRLAILIAVSAALFIIVPILISFRVPIILTRYWLIGSPLCLAPLALLIGLWRMKSEPAHAPIAAAAALIVISLPLSFWAAADFVAAKPTWRGIPIVKAQLGTCGPNAIHVLGFTPGFALITHAPATTFVDARTLNESVRTASETCNILGWSEHYVLRLGPDFMARATNAELLQLLKLAYTPDEVAIDRHASGFVVRRRP